jgi:hypothetical protein
MEKVDTTIGIGDWIYPFVLTNRRFYSEITICNENKFASFVIIISTNKMDTNFCTLRLSKKKKRAPTTTNKSSGVPSCMKQLIIIIKISVISQYFRNCLPNIGLFIFA